MKKTVTINISGLVFHIDEDAYEKLKDYLSKISIHFNREKDSREIISDIESRIAELFNKKLSPERNVVDIEMVDQIIGIMGLPEDFVELSEEEPEAEPNSSTNQQPYYQKSKKLYRDPDSMVFGGVCSGLAHYLNADKVLIRVLFILLFLITSGVALPVYIILWIAVPRARTTAQRLEMRGDPINVENIGKKVKEGTTEKKENNTTSNSENGSNNYPKESRNNGSSVFGKLVGSILIITGFLMFLALIVGIFTTSKLFGLIPGLFPSSDHNLILNHIFSQSMGSTLIFSLLIIFGIPLLLIIYFGTKLLFNFVSNSRSVFLSSLGVWIIGIIIAISSAAGAINVFSTTATTYDSKNLAFPNDTIFVKLNHSDFDNYNFKAGINNLKILDAGGKEMMIASPKFTIERSRGNYVELILNKNAKGNNYRSAKNNASRIDYDFSVSGDTLLLNPYFEFGNQGKWRSQSIEITLNLPEGKIVFLDDNLLPVIENIDNNSNTWEGDMVGKYWKMNQEGLALLK